MLARGSVRCGVRDALPGFSFLTPEGDHEGFDSDFCRVIAAAVLGDAGAVDFVIENGGGDEQFILPETISKEPLGPAVLDGDTEWAQVRKHAAGRRPAQPDARAGRRDSCRSGGGGGGWWR